MKKIETFVLLDRSFEVRSLDPMTSLRALKSVVGVLAPLASALASKGDQDHALTEAISGLSNLPELAALFRRQCKFYRLESAALVDLDPFFDDVFEGDPALLLAWLVACVKFEYGTFLAGNGQKLLAGMVSDFGSLVGSPGKSGDSSQIKG